MERGKKKKWEGEEETPFGEVSINLIILTIIEPPLWQDTGETKTQSMKERLRLGDIDRPTDECSREPRGPQYTS